jgi:hypothetical protein
MNVLVERKASLYVSTNVNVTLRDCLANLECAVARQRMGRVCFGWFRGAHHPLVSKSPEPNSNHPGQSQPGDDSMAAVAAHTTKAEASQGEQDILHPTATVPLVVVKYARIEASLDLIELAMPTL